VRAGTLNARFQQRGFSIGTHKISVEAGGLSTLDAVLVPEDIVEAPLTLKIVGRGGSRIEGAQLSAWGADRSFGYGKTDALGSFVIQRWAPGPLHVRIEAAEHPINVKQIALSRGGPSSHTIALRHGSGSVLGRVVGPSGAARTRLEVSLKEKSGGNPRVDGLAYTDAEGRFAFHHLPPGSFDVLVWTTGPSWEKVVKTGDPEVLFVIR
jgi:hypothetical protein